MKNYVSAVLSAVLLLWPVSGLANELKPIGDMTVTATRSKEKLTSIPAKVEIIDAAEIEMTTGETLTEQLKKNASVGVVEYLGALAGIGIRGFGPEISGITKHSLILIDGRPAGATNLATILSHSIERIEVLKGPASSLYGAEAMGGVVNIITRKTTGALTGSVELGLGSWDTNFQKAALGGSITRTTDFDIAVNRFDRQDDFEMGTGDTRANTQYKTEGADLRFGMDFGDSWRIDIGADGYRGQDIETPGDLFNGDNKPGQKDLERWGIDATLGGMIGRSNHVSLTVYATEELSENYNRYSGDKIVDPYRSYDSETEWIGLQAKDTIEWGNHKFILGFDYQDIETMYRNYGTNGQRTAPYSPDESRENLAGFVQSIWRFLDKRLTATLGVRYDTFDVGLEPTPYKTDFTPKTVSFNTFSPRAGLNYLFDSGVRLHTTVGKAFVPPTAWQLGGYSVSDWSGITTKGNPDLDPESSITYDIGVGYELPSKGLNADLTYFYTDIDDKIGTQRVEKTDTYQNLTGAEIHGLEYQLSYDIGAPLKWDRTLAFFVNGTRIFHAEEEQTDGTLKDALNVADHIINYGIRYDDGMIGAKLHCRYQEGFRDKDWNATGAPEIAYPSFNVVDLSTSFRFKQHHKILLKIDNILDHNYYEKKGFPKPGRGFLVSYTYFF